MRIVSGNAALASDVTDGKGHDLVVLDDFLYSEPVAVPEPSSMILAGASLLIGLLW